MDDPRVLRIITVGLILAALAVVYFLFTGGFSVNKPKVNQNQTAKVSPSPTSRPTTAATPSATPSVVGQALPTAVPTPASAYDTITNRSQENVQNLPNTGFPGGLVVVFSISALVAGYSLRRFPR